MITDFRINSKGELEGKVIPPAKWEEMYTKEEVVSMLTDIQLEIKEKHRKEDFMNDWNNGYNTCLADAHNSIQQRINSLKENTGDIQK